MAMAEDDEEYFRVVPRIQNGFKFKRLESSGSDDVMLSDNVIKIEDVEYHDAAGTETFSFHLFNIYGSQPCYSENVYFNLTGSGLWSWCTKTMPPLFFYCFTPASVLS